MLPLLKSDRRPQKCQVAHGELPAFIDPKQPPHKRKPFDAIWALKWCHTVDVLLPVELRDVIQQAEQKQLELGRIEERNDRYAKVIMKLGEVLDGDFFTEYIKKGNILMLSEGRPGVDTVYALQDGILSIQVDRPTYERLGLQGRPIRDSGLRHSKNRFLIELNLRLPSMLHGKKGFERLMWACKNVLVQSVTWLFYDCQAKPQSKEPGVADAPAPIDKHHPLYHTLHPTTTIHSNVCIPSLTSATISCAMFDLKTASSEDESYFSDLEEYFSLLCLGSARVQAGDRIDPFLSRYEPPSPGSGEEEAGVKLAKGNVVQLRYRGFVPAAHVVRSLVLLTKGLAERAKGGGDGISKNEGWGIIQAHGFEGECAAILIGDDGAASHADAADTNDAAIPGEKSASGAAVEWEEEAELASVQEQEQDQGDAHSAPAPAAPPEQEQKKREPDRRMWFVCWDHPAPL